MRDHIPGILVFLKTAYNQSAFEIMTDKIIEFWFYWKLVRFNDFGQTFLLD